MKKIERITAISFFLEFQGSDDCLEIRRTVVPLHRRVLKPFHPLAVYMMHGSISLTLHGPYL